MKESKMPIVSLARRDGMKLFALSTAKALLAKQIYISLTRGCEKGDTEKGEEQKRVSG